MQKSIDLCSSFFLCRFLRNNVTNFKSTTGYVKRSVYKPPPVVIEDVQTEVDPNTTEVSATSLSKITDIKKFLFITGAICQR